MGQPLGLLTLLLLPGVGASACGKKHDALEISTKDPDFPGVKLARIDAPEFVRSLSLLYPHAEVFRVENRIVQKTGERLPDIVGYYKKTFSKHNFTESTKLEQVGGAFLEYERAMDNLDEKISIDIQKLPYSESYLIRIARSEAKPRG